MGKQAFVDEYPYLVYSGDATASVDGTLDITENGTYDVLRYASASVDVPGIVPSGTLDITGNGTYHVTDYAYADVDVYSIPLIIAIPGNDTPGYPIYFPSIDGEGNLDLTFVAEGTDTTVFTILVDDPGDITNDQDWDMVKTGAEVEVNSHTFRLWFMMPDAVTEDTEVIISMA